MNKLVSKNPVLRFKLGNRIVKFQQAGKVYASRPREVHGAEVNGERVGYVEIPDKGYVAISPSGKAYSYNGNGAVGQLNFKPINLSNYDLYHILRAAQTPGKITGFTSRDASAVANYWVNKKPSYLRTSSKIVVNKLEKTPTIQEVSKEVIDVSPKGLTSKTGSTTSSVKKIPVNKPAVVTKSAIVNKSSVIPKTSFYGQGIGGTVLARGNNFNGLISDDARNKLIATGKFDNNSFSSVLNFLTALNNYFANDGAGSITVDDKWGNQTQKAFDLALAKAGESHGLIFNPNVNLYNNTIETPLSTVSYGYTPTEKIQVTTPQRIYNRADVRDFIRSRGKNAYGFSGALRRALRMVLNGQGTDTDRAIVSGMGIFKKGGLISKNPIKRFKSNFR